METQTINRFKAIASDLGSQTAPSPSPATKSSGPKSPSTPTSPEQSSSRLICPEWAKVAKKAESLTAGYTDALEPRSSIRVTVKKGVFTIGNSTAETHALKSLADFTSLPTTAILWAVKHPQYKDTVASLFNEVLEAEERSGDYLIRRRKNGSIRHIASEKYTPVSNSDVVNRLSEIVGASEYASKCVVSADEMMIDILDEDRARHIVGDSKYKFGVRFWNSEIGTRTIGGGVFVEREVCQNGMCIPVGRGFHRTMFHRLAKAEDLLDEAVLVFNMLVEHSSSIIDNTVRRLGYLRGVELPKDQIDKVVVQTAKSLGLGKSEQSQWLTGWREQGEETTPFGLLQGLTHAAKTMSDRERIEELAFRLVDTPGDVDRHWAGVVASATELRESEYVHLRA